MQKKEFLGLAQRDRGKQGLVLLIFTALLAACSAIGPAPSATPGGPIPDAHGRVFVLREKQMLYSAKPVSVSVDGMAVGDLASGTFLATDVPAGEKTLTVAALLSRRACAIAALDSATAAPVPSLAISRPSSL
jgi:hypothetical protein